MRKSALVILTAVMLAVVAASGAVAQEVNGSISGFVYRDVNADGICTEGGEPSVQNINMQFVNRDNDTTLTQATNSTGGFSVAALGAGTWQVTVNPGDGWRVTSQQTQQIVISEQDPDHNNLSFCIVQVTSSGGGQVVLPESGAPLSPPLLVAAGLGLLLLFTGGGLVARSRKEQ